MKYNYFKTSVTSYSPILSFLSFLIAQSISTFSLLIRDQSKYHGRKIMSASPISRLYYTCLFLNIIPFLTFTAVASSEIPAQHCHLDSLSISGESKNLGLGETYPDHIYEHSPLHSSNLTSKGILEPVLDLVGPILGTQGPKSKNPQSLPPAVRNKEELQLQDLVKTNNFKLIEHQVNTTDNWTLYIYQLSNELEQTRRNNDLPPVLVGHGLLSSAADWLALKRKSGLPFLLADNGFDVWLLNSRGNDYTKQNEFSDSSYEYWNFSVHEMGKYDVPAVIDYILKNTTSEKINYVGYSMSTTSFFICMSENSTYNKYINKMAAIAPAVFLDKTSPLGTLLAKLGIVEDALVQNKYTGGRVFTPVLQDVLRTLGKTVCHSRKLTGFVCESIADILNGAPSDGVTFDGDTARIAENYFPAPTSGKTLAHFLQLIRTGKFRQYDYRFLSTNLNNKEIPPSYNLAATTSEVILIRGESDTLISLEGVKQLQESLTNAKNKRIINAKGFNHLSFVYSTQAAKDVYKKILNYFLN